MANATRLTATLAAFIALGSCAVQAPREVDPKPPGLTSSKTVQVTGPEVGWPPKPKGVTMFTQVGDTPIPGSLTDAVEAQIRQAVVQDPAVRQALGSRFAFITIDEIEPPKGGRRDPAAPVPTRVTFFSHQNNVAVEVFTRGTRVERVLRRPDYQPPEGREEVQAAIALAERDPRLSGRLERVTGSAIRTQREPGKPGAGNRLLYVTFHEANEDLPRFFALVDLTLQQVLDAGPAR